MKKDKNILEKIFTTYNEITKYFIVKVVMKSNGKYTIELTKKHGGGDKNPPKIDLLIQMFLEFKNNQEAFNKMFLEFKNNQEAFNKMVLEQFKKHGWIK